MLVLERRFGARVEEVIAPIVTFVCFEQTGTAPTFDCVRTDVETLSQFIGSYQTTLPQTVVTTS